MSCPISLNEPSVITSIILDPSDLGCEWMNIRKANEHGDHSCSPPPTNSCNIRGLTKALPALKVCKVPPPAAALPSAAHNYAVPLPILDGRYSLVSSHRQSDPRHRIIIFPKRYYLDTYLCFEEVMSRYKYCIVPQCKSTTRSTPNKLFFSVPTGEKRKEWCLVVGRVPGEHKTLSPRCNRFICEDHFNLQEDMENYIMWRTVGVGKLMLKKGVLPHKFECRNQQRGTKKSDTTSDRVKRTNSEVYHTEVITEIKDEYIKKQTSGRFYIYKGNDCETQEDLQIEIKKEVTEYMAVSEEKTNIIVKDEVDDIETYVFNVHYDSDTGEEYLIDLPKRMK